MVDSLSVYPRDQSVSINSLPPEAPASFLAEFTNENIDDLGIRLIHIAIG